MKLSNLMIAAAVIALVFGLGFILAPAWMMSLYGLTLDAPGQWIGRYFGSALIGIAVASWQARNATKGEALRAIVLGYFVLSLTGLVVVILDRFMGSGNALVWINVLVYLFLTAGFGYFQFVKPVAA